MWMRAIRGYTVRLDEAGGRRRCKVTEQHDPVIRFLERHQVSAATLPAVHRARPLIVRHALEQPSQADAAVAVTPIGAVQQQHARVIAPGRQRVVRTADDVNISRLANLRGDEGLYAMATEAGGEASGVLALVRIGAVVI